VEEDAEKRKEESKRKGEEVLKVEMMGIKAESMGRQEREIVSASFFFFFFFFFFFSYFLQLFLCHSDLAYFFPPLRNISTVSGVPQRLVFIILSSQERNRKNGQRRLHLSFHKFFFSRRNMTQKHIRKK
jgi:hypothetical protein